MNSNVLNKVAMLLSGSVLAQLINIISLPILSRIYTPLDIGIQNVFLSTLNILMPLFSLSLPMAIIQDEVKREKYINSSIMISTLFFSLILCVFFILFKDIVSDMFGTQYIYTVLFFILVAVFFNSFQQSLELKLIKNGDYLSVSKASVKTAISLNSFKIFSGVLISSFWCLLVSIIASMSVKIFLQNKSLGASNRMQYSLNLNEIKSTIYKHRDFPLYRAPQALLSTVSLSIPLYFITIQFGLSEAAFYSLALTLLMIPVNLIGNSLTTVLYPELVRLGKNKSSLDMLIKYFVSFIIIGAICSVIVFFFGKPLVNFFLGDIWEKTADYASWLSIIMIFQLANRPIISAVTAFSYQNLMLWFEILSFFIKIIVFYMAVIFFDSINIIMIYSITSGFMYFLFSLYILNIIRVEFGGLNE